MTMTADDLDTIFESELQRHGYEYRREPGAHIITYVLLAAGVECGRWDIIPPVGRMRSARVGRRFTARDRAIDVSVRDFGDAQHWPEDERDRDRFFVEAHRLVKEQIDLVFLRGEYGKEWAEHLKKRTQDSTTPQKRVATPGRARYPENQWAREQIAAGVPYDEVFAEWKSRRRDAKRRPLDDYGESFKRAIRKE